MNPRELALATLFPDVVGLPAVAVTGLTQDSRSAGAGVVFIALKGTRRHGLDYAEQALQRGAAAVLWDESGFCPLPDSRCIRVPDLRQRLPGLARQVFGSWPVERPIVAVTGTDGKTSVTHQISMALSASGRPCAVIGTLGVGVPGALRPMGHTTPGLLDLYRYLAELARTGFAAVALEASSHALAQGRLAGLQPTVAILTQLGTDHLDYHGSQAEYAAAKARLFAMPGLQARVLNLDDAFGRELYRRYADRATTGATTGATAGATAGAAECWSYALHGFAVSGPRHLQGSAVQARDDGLSFRVTGAGLDDEIQVPLFGDFQVANLLAALAGLLAVGQEPHAAAAALAAVSGVPGRMERFPLPSGATLVVDYAHTAQALRTVLTALRPHVRGRLGVVFGCGGDRDPGKRAPMGAAASELADWVIITDDNPRHEAPAAIRTAILDGCAGPAEVRVIGDRAQAIERAAERAGPGDIVLLAGKGHESVQIVQDVAYPFSDREHAAALAAGSNGLAEDL